MYPFTCPNEQDHTFALKLGSQTEYVCSYCGVEYSAYELQVKKLDDLKDSMRKIVNYTNGGDVHLFAEALYGVMRETHRTLQQNFIRGVITFINQMQKMPTDPRNEACVEWCKEVSNINAYLPVI
jgi:hypothetical protein